ncbi:hypothetical protein [uncultured Arcticibacterium sp.]|uniref:hypothetical protein n=1 Tax=uncultured Arcticibacterium sp. TaxID=2173042 RepID=UPI0030FAD472
MKSLYIIALLASGFLFLKCSESSKETSQTLEPPQLTIAWETDTLLQIPESVIYDKNNNVFYVSCIGPKTTAAHDGDGYIAKVGPNGEIIENKWLTGLDEPTGLAIVGDTLYVANIDQLVSIQISTAEIISKQDIATTTFLNDVASNSSGDVLIADTDLNAVFIKSGEEISILYQSEELGGLNGIYCEEKRTLLTGSGSGKLYALENETLTVLADSMKGADGIEKYKDGYFISSWKGQLYYLDTNGKRSKLLDTEAQKVNAADIDVIEEQNLLIVPTFFANKLIAYKID